MNNGEEPIGVEDALIAAERFILDRHPYAKNIAFERAVLKTHGNRQVYELAGHCKLVRWLNAAGEKRLCEIKIDAYSANIIGCHGM